VDDPEAIEGDSGQQFPVENQPAPPVDQAKKEKES
jgi:hypothetical protein